MIDLLTCEVIRDEIAPDFPWTYIGLPHDGESITMPCILLDIRGDALVGGPLQRGALTVAVMSQADDSTVAEHIELVQEVTTAIKGVTGSGSAIQIYGVVATSSEAQNTERHWITNLQFTLGYGPQP
jgi:hypothetical protein